MIIVHEVNITDNSIVATHAIESLDEAVIYAQTMNEYMRYTPIRWKIQI